MARVSGLPSAFTLLGRGLQLWRRQPVLWKVLLWFIAVPSIVIHIGARLATVTQEGVELTLDTVMTATPSEMYALPWIALLFFSMWAVCCTLLLGRRLLGNPAGRGRESFRTLAHQGQRWILPIILCALIREIITILLLLPLLIGSFLLLWKFQLLPSSPDEITSVLMLPQYMVNALVKGAGSVNAALLLAGLVLLAIPSIVFRIRTTFYDIALVGEKLGCRKSLRRSSAVVRSRFFGVFFRVVLMTVCVAAPIILLFLAMHLAALPSILRGIVNDILEGAAMMLLTLSSAALFKHLR
jgi:hypothetical protein